MSTKSTPAMALLPPFTRETEILKVRAVEDIRTRDPGQVVSAGYAEERFWRNPSEFLHGRPEVLAFLTRKWNQELDYRLFKGI